MYLMRRMRYERIKRGWSQGQVAKMVGVGSGAICALEQGRAGKSDFSCKPWRVTWKLAELYGVPPEDLLKWVHVPESEMREITELWNRKVAEGGRRR